MKDAQRPDHISLNTLIEHLKEGRFVVPDFQREFEWRPWDIKELLRSIFLDYYIGSLLLWKGKRENFEALSCEILYGFDDLKEQRPWNYVNGRPEHIVLDGQQRLTAIHYAFVAPNVPLPARQNRAAYFIYVDRFLDERYEEAFDYCWLSQRSRELMNDRASQYREHIFPLSVVGSGGWALLEWCQGYEAYWKRAAEVAASGGGGATGEAGALRYAERAKSFGLHVKGIAEQYQISYIELDRDLAVDKVCDIFTQINSRGIRLDVFDLINALLKPKGLQLKHMWRKAAPRFDFLDSAKMNVYVLQVMSILSQAYCSPKYLYYLLPGQEKQTRNADGKLVKEVLIQDVGEFQTRWDEAVDSIEHGIRLLKHPQEFGVSSSQYLPYVSILPIFSALQKICGELPPTSRLKAQRKLRCWYWASVFINRYSGSVESTSARDFLDVRAWLDCDDARPPLLQEFRERYRNLELRTEVKKGTAVYNGIFNLLVIQGARDWMTGNVPQYGDLDDHHIVPVSWGNDNLKSVSVHTVLNRTPLTAGTNRKIVGDRLPNEYLPALIASSGEGNVRSILDSHFISSAAQSILMRRPFTADDFEAFISERQRTLLEAIESLLIKERLDLSPSLRELDRDVEAVELGLRRCVAVTLSNEVHGLPPHIASKLKESVQRAVHRSATLDGDAFSQLASLLEFADLRDIQEVFTSKATWEKFQPRFVNKETLIARFGQLAELRNGIRHSRTVGDIARKEGEAAILWFRQVLRKGVQP